MSDLLLLAADESGLPRIPVGDVIDRAFDWLTDNLDPVFEAISTVTEGSVDGVQGLLLLLPPVVFAVLLAVIGLAARSVVFALGSLAGLLLIQSMRLWEQSMQTLALVLVATLVSVVVAVPVGIAAAKSTRVSAVVRPVLDFMQTMPAFVYLVPAVTFFGIGLVPGIVTTIIFALPPGVRLTELGIRQVDRETVEAGRAFGSSPGQILRTIELPLARPTIMAGVNQVIMLALSMAVIAGLIGAGGLGGVVVTSISRLDIGLGFEGGLAVVVLAIYLDRLTSSFGGGGRSGRLLAVRRLLGRRRPPTTPAEPGDTAAGAQPAPALAGPQR